MNLTDIPNFRNLIISHDPTMPVDHQWTAKLILWDHETRTSTAYISWTKTAGERFQIEGQETPEAAIETVLAKYAKRDYDKETSFGR